MSYCQIVSAELSAAINFLSIMDLTSEHSPGDKHPAGVTPLFTLRITLKNIGFGRPNTITQRTLLEPIRNMGFIGGELKPNGNIDVGYADELMASMMPTLLWVRATAWKLYFFLCRIKEAADEALRSGNYELATTKYEQCFIFRMLAIDCNYRINLLDDDGWKITIKNFEAVIEVNLHLCDLCAEPCGLDLSRYADVNEQPDSDVGMVRLHHYRGLWLLSIGTMPLALTAFRKACELDPTYILAQRHLQILETYMDSSDCFNQVLLPMLLSTLPNDPLPLLDPVYLPSKTIANERYLLRHFKYTGSLMEQIEESKEADEGKMDSEAKKLERAIERSQKQNDSIQSFWIGSDQVENTENRSRELEYVRRRLVRRTMPWERARALYPPSNW